MRLRFRQLALPVLAVWLAAVGLPVAFGAQAADEAAFRRISDKLICQCGCHYGLSNCPHLDCPSAPLLRAAIREKLAAGQSEEQALKALVADFGPVLLGAPPPEGFNLSAWVMPFLALVAGGWLVQRIVRRWRARQPAAVADPALVEQYRKTIEREIKRLDE